MMLPRYLITQITLITLLTFRRVKHGAQVDGDDIVPFLYGRPMARRVLSDVEAERN